MFVSVLFFVIIMFLLLIAGYALRKVNLIKENATGSFVAVLLYVCSPMVIFKSLFYSKDKISNPTEPGLLIGMGITFVIAFIIFFAVFFIAKAVFFKEKNRTAANAYIFASVFGNVAFIGIPFVQYVLQGDPLLPYALVYSSIFNVVFNILCWTLGVYIITRDIKTVKPLKLILNPVVIITLVALPLFFLRVDLTKYVPPLADAVTFLGNMTTPISMIIVGIRLAGIKFTSIFTDGWAYVSSGLKLIVAPTVTFGLVMLLRALGVFGAVGSEFYMVFGKAICLSLIILSALPAAASTIAFCEKYDGDSNSAVKAFMNCTFLSLAAMPILIPLMCSVL